MQTIGRCYNLLMFPKLQSLGELNSLNFFNSFSDGSSYHYGCNPTSDHNVGCNGRVALSIFLLVDSAGSEDCRGSDSVFMTNV